MHDASSIDVMAKLCRLQHYVLLERELTALTRAAGSNTSLYGRYPLDALAAVVALALIDVDNPVAMPLEARDAIFASLEVRLPRQSVDVDAASHVLERGSIFKNVLPSVVWICVHQNDLGFRELQISIAQRAGAVEENAAQVVETGNLLADVLRVRKLYPQASTPAQACS